MHLQATAQNRLEELQQQLEETMLRLKVRGTNG